MSTDREVLQQIKATLDAHLGEQVTPPPAETCEQMVTRLYRTKLLREPDAGGLAYWTGRCNAGMTEAEMLPHFGQEVAPTPPPNPPPVEPLPPSSSPTPDTVWYGSPREDAAFVWEAQHVPRVFRHGTTKTVPVPADFAGPVRFYSGEMVGNWANYLTFSAEGPLVPGQPTTSGKMRVGHEAMFYATGGPIRVTVHAVGDSPQELALVCSVRLYWDVNYAPYRGMTREQVEPISKTVAGWDWGAFAIYSGDRP